MSTSPHPKKTTADNVNAIRNNVTQVRNHGDCEVGGSGRLWLAAVHADHASTGANSTSRMRSEQDFSRLGMRANSTSQGEQAGRRTFPKTNDFRTLCHGPRRNLPNSPSARFGGNYCNRSLVKISNENGSGLLALEIISAHNCVAASPQCYVPIEHSEDWLRH